MSSPDEQVAGQIGQMAADAPNVAASEADIAEAAASHIGAGVTEADLDAIKAQLASFQAQLAQQQAATAKAAPDALTSSVAALTTYLQGHGDPAALELAEKAAEAAGEATKAGDTGPLEGIVADIEQHLRRNPPAPGDRFHYLNALDAAAVHLPDVIKAFEPLAKVAAAAVA